MKLIDISKIKTIQDLNETDWGSCLVPPANTIQAHWLALKKDSYKVTDEAIYSINRLANDNPEIAKFSLFWNGDDLYVCQRLQFNEQKYLESRAVDLSKFGIEQINSFDWEKILANGETEITDQRYSDIANNKVTGVAEFFTSYSKIEYAYRCLQYFFTQTAAGALRVLKNRRYDPHFQIFTGFTPAYKSTECYLEDMVNDIFRDTECSYQDAVDAAVGTLKDNDDFGDPDSILEVTVIVRTAGKVEIAKPEVKESKESTFNAIADAIAGKEPKPTENVPVQQTVAENDVNVGQTVGNSHDQGDYRGSF